ncbi:UDP-N-acetylmuramoyl-tripeptide--D-alanyl-D-alanine ligase [Jatrophihabitans endophyticus]|uniref:UDP-N-acetylmuramoyl-tripeptide--D-alanyl-D- alanine ligase n=1 Tax=Jatrophihabitans endophyticus TaxID=1206085 RepID=UPI001A01E464|nr:UDP-N-acetylmuramoyl-tripeptide--D-alanyl-D-alanine ligase [Jatrophihabitans endophyticus]MBE7188182.1 UDP-N-acetylmuramoyl-tripeptide--D-alanyl-D-alanine ligase [Jatrophihabitans endophyticus]
MIDLTLGEIADIVGGEVIGDPAVVVTGDVEYDTRKLHAGGLFLAFAGEQVDGHDYLDAAAAAGAVGAIVTRKVGSGPAQVLVGDTLAAATALASEVLRRVPDVTVIGITGSSGKTTTKDLMTQVLGTTARTVSLTGSHNNELGVPYVVLRVRADSRFLVLEMGARGIGHIRHLTRIAPPQIGVVLNVGSAHLGEFGSREAIAQAKGELVEALPADGLAVLNADDPLVLAMRSRTAARVVTVGRSPGADVRAEDVRLDALGHASFTLVAAQGRAEVTLRHAGAHHVANALAVAAVGLDRGMTPDAVALALGQAAPISRWRMETTERADGVLVVNDAYNANPESMRAALTTLAAIGQPRITNGGRTIAVLGEMAELGPDADAEHEAVGRLAGELGVSQVVAVGAAARPIVSGAALEGSGDDRVRWVPDTDAAVALLRRELRAPDVVLVKASRAAGLERVAEAIAEDEGPASGAGEGSGTG